MTWVEKIAAKRDMSSAAIPRDWRIPEAVLAQLSHPLDSHANNLIESNIVRQCGILTDQELRITEDFTTGVLLRHLSSGRLTSVEVTIAFSKRAAIAQQLTRCLTETFFDEALTRARHLDELRSQGKTIGPLHGLPVSLKDSFRVAEHQSTLGIVSFLDKSPANKNSALVDVLLKLGAVLYVKTNVPQTLATVDSENHIFGRTLNPWNTMLGPGGSSGGEGALVAFRGSPLGIGTDVGGSIRIPSLCCGVYGFKPTVGRIPYGGQENCSKSGMNFLVPAAGPLANDVKSLEILTRAVLQADPVAYDATALDVPWRNVPDRGRQKLRIGLVPEDANFPLHPPVKRALAEALKKLQACGHEIIPLAPDQCRVADATEVAWQIFGIDEAAYRHVEASQEGLVESVKYTHGLAASLKPNFVPDTTGLDRLDRLAVLNTKRAELCEAWGSVWSMVDVVMSPSAQSTAVEHDKFGLPPYTTLTNVLDYPSCIIPFGRVVEDDINQTFTPLADQIAPPYNPRLTQGAPCSVQIFTRSFRDEECLALTEIIDGCLNGNEDRSA
ncbi:Acetamidase [Colletotrichum siamense]|nr:Acetamidase [Colletotrichum siamense]